VGFRYEEVVITHRCKEARPLTRRLRTRV